MNSLQIREKFFEFFEKNGHTRVASSSLIPAQDPTLLFANAGMNQFKDVFLGKEERSYTRAVSIQKCIRAGGKHNDLENVGFTKRHLTFFEMMGNFSFGDYFKKEAIRFAWDFVTKEIKLNPETIYASVFQQDEEACNIWNQEIGLPKNRIVKLGARDNFWQMGDTGPCGPCTELYVDRGLSFGCGLDSCAPGCDCDRFLEFWNLVFMQFDRQPDGTDKPLKRTGVDTGMGFERLCAILQDKDSVFETDIFEPIIKQIEKLTGISYQNGTEIQKAAFKVICDHIRSASFAIADGCTPSNEGRGYVLRKIIRRAALFAQKLSKKNFFPQVAQAVIDSMGDIYPELKTNQNLIISLLESETEKFSANLIHGQSLLQEYFEKNKEKKLVSGESAFKLYDTYGFPLELTKVISAEHGFKVDLDGFESLMEKQRIQSGKKISKSECILDETVYTKFTGYDEHITKTAVTAIVVDNQQVDKIKPGQSGYIVTEQSPFYVECGGQISDQGFIRFSQSAMPLKGLKKFSGAIGAFIEPAVEIKVGDSVTLEVDSPRRINTMKNHTATHLLQAALIDLLGKQVKQSGSVVEPDYLRFDFTYEKNLTPDQIKQIEDLVNKKILENIPVKVKETTLKDATSHGVIAFFGEKYNPEKVRVVEVPGFSAELCGGTHVSATGDIGAFKITEITALSAGNRRIVAVTGPAAVDIFQQSFETVKSLSQEFKVQIHEVLEAVKKQKEQLRLASTEIKNLKKQIFKSQYTNWINQTEQISSVPVNYIVIENSEATDLKEIAQDLVKLKPGLYFLVSPGVRNSLFISVSPEFKNVNLADLGNWLKTQGFQGGGKETLQGSFSGNLKEYEKLIKNWLAQNIK